MTEVLFSFWFSNLLSFPWSIHAEDDDDDGQASELESVSSTYGCYEGLWWWWEIA